MITEHWLPEGAVFNIDNFSPIICSSRKDTQFNRFGGCAVYFRKQSNIKFLQAKEVNVCQEAQICHIEFQDMDLYVIYRSPNQSTCDLEIFTEFIESIKSPNSVICGDLNFPSITWDPEPSSSNEYIQRILIHMEIIEAYQHVRVPTHQQGNILDLVFATPDIVQDIIVRNDGFKSDHFPIFIKLKMDHPLSEEKIILCPKRTDTEVFAIELSKLDWLGLDYEDVDRCAIQIATAISGTFDDMTPRVTPKEKAEAFLPTTRRQIQKVKSMEKLLHPELHAAKKELYRLLEEERKRKHESFLQYLAKHPNNIFRAFSKKKFQPRITNIRLQDGSITSNPSIIAETLNLYYASVLTTSNKIDIDWFQNEGIVNNVEITETLIIQAIKSLKVSDSRGPDNVSKRMLKACSQVIATPLAILFRRVLETGQVPEIWRCSSIMAIPKPGCDILAPSGTRGISCESVLGKLLEKTISTYFMAKLEEAEFFYPNQHGFRKSKSTYGCLYNLFNDLFQDLQDGFKVILVAADYSKAFDVVDHAKLLHACQRAGFSGPIGRYIQNWLSGRTQYVTHEGHQSAHTQVTSSVIQGSNCGPGLFLILTNTCQSQFKHCVTHTYADDCSIYFKYKEATELENLQSDMENFYAWSVKVGQKLNMAKTMALQFGSEKDNLNIVIGGESIKIVDTIKILGVTFSSSMGFEPHRQIVINRVTKAVNACKMNLEGAEFKVKLQVWNSYIKPLTNYASTIWFNEKICAELDDQYRSFFGSDQPPKNARIPLSPSEDIYQHALLQIKKEYDENLFQNIAGASKSNLNFSRQNEKGWLFVSTRARLSSFGGERSLSQKAASLWNTACKDGIPSVTEIKEFIKSRAELSTPGKHYRELLTRGELIGKKRKQFLVLQDYHTRKRTFSTE